MQEQQARQSRREETTEPEATEVDRSRTDEVIEDANCCLADIDEALAAHEAEEESAEVVYAKGHPDKYDMYYATGSHDAWIAAHNAYAKAYEQLTGVVHQCGCGGCGSALRGYDGDGRGGGPNG